MSASLKWFDRSQAGSILGPGASSFSPSHQSLSFYVPGGHRGGLSGSLLYPGFPLSDRPLGVCATFLPLFPTFVLSVTEGMWGEKLNVGPPTPVPQGLSPRGCEERAWSPWCIQKKLVSWTKHIFPIAIVHPSPTTEVQEHVTSPENTEVRKKTQPHCRSSQWHIFLAWFLVSF